MAIFYAQYYRKIYSGADTRAIEYIFESEWRRGESIYKLVRSVGFSPKVVYDIGCGAGGTLAYLSAQGCTVYGCDFDEDYLDRARQAGVIAHKGGIDTLASYTPADLIILHHVLEHLRDPIALLKEARKLLSSNGVIYIALPGVFNIGKQYPYLGYFFQNAHAWHFCLQTLDSIASRAGLRRVFGDEVIESLYVPSGEMPFVATDHGLPANILNYVYKVGEDTKWKCRLAVMDRCMRYTFRRVGGGRVYRMYRFAKRMVVRR
ncbi:MAG: class I SAM-dependent methyltransferase [Chthonomonadetes bacterium]|nr:class I SAM-dependent methyltransferase [Chthonomonadetes bacterium]